MTPAAHRASFFRQSGWLMMANIGGGVLMWAVHFLNKFIPPGQYGSFGAFLAIVMLLPTIPLQMVLAQQTAKALATNRRGELAGVFRLMWFGTSAVWLVLCLVVLACQNTILARWNMSNPVGLWITMGIVLLSLWMPLFFGLLQGQQNFLWLGWSQMAGAIGRIVVASICVILLHAYAAGMMTGVLLGTAAAGVLAAWHSRDLWWGHAEGFDWQSLMRQIVPLLAAFLAFQILFTADTLFVKAYFSEAEADFYVSAGTLSRALMWLVLPLAAVMFPRLVHSAAKSEKSNLMGLVLAGTAILSVVGALGLSVLGPLVVKLVYKPEYVGVASAILPWYASAMIPLALANVLLNNLLARPDSKLFLALCALGVAVCYLFALTRFHDSLVTVLKTLGTCNLVLFIICSVFAWRTAAGGKTPLGN